MSIIRVFNKTNIDLSLVAYPSSQIIAFSYSDFQTPLFFGNKPLADELVRLMQLGRISVAIDGVPATQGQVASTILATVVDGSYATLTMAPPSETLAEFRSVPTTTYARSGTQAMCAETGSLYAFDLESTATDNATSVVRPNDRPATVAGRWVRKLVGGNVSPGIQLKDEGTPLSGVFTSIDFVGATVAVTDLGSNSARVTISSGTIGVGGDITGTTSAATVVALQGRALTGTAPTNGQVIAWNNGASQWQPTTITPSGSAGGDLGGTYPNPTVTDLTIASEAQGDILYRNATNWVRLAAGTSGYVLTTQGPAANPIWSAAAGGAFPLKFVVDARFGVSPPSGAYSDVQTAITAANAAALPALVQIYDGAYNLGGSVVNVAGGVTLAGMGANPAAVSITGMLNWNSGDGGGLANLFVQAPSGASAPPVALTSASFASLFGLDNVYLSCVATTPDIPAFNVGSGVGSNFTVRMLNCVMISTNGAGAIQQGGRIQSTNCQFETGTLTSKYAFDLAGGSFESFADVFRGSVRLGGTGRTLVRPRINASGSNNAAISLSTTSQVTLTDPFIQNGNASNWITASSACEVGLTGLKLRAATTATAHTNVSFMGGSLAYEPSRVRTADVSGVGTFPATVNNVRHTPGANFDALTLPAAGEMVGSVIFTIQNRSATFVSRITQGASTTVDGGTTYDLRPLECVTFFFDSANSNNYAPISTKLLYGGDLDYGSSAGTQKVIALQTRAVAATAPTAGQVLTWNAAGTTWQPGNQTSLKYIVDKTLPTGSNTPTGLYQDLEVALTAANAAASSGQHAIVSVYPGQYTTASARFVLSNYVSLQGMSTDPRDVEIQKPVRFASGAVVASLNNVFVNNSTNEDCLTFYQSSSTITLRNCVVRQTNSGNSKGVGRVDSNGTSTSVTFIDCDLYAVDYDTVRAEVAATLNFVRGSVECARSDTAKRAVNVTASSGTVTVTEQDTVFLGAVQQNGASTILLQMQRGRIDLTSNASVPLQFGGASATISAFSYLRHLTIARGTANEAIYSGSGGISTTIVQEGLNLPNNGQIGTFVRPLNVTTSVPTFYYPGGGNVTLTSDVRFAYLNNLGNCTLPSLTEIPHGTVVELFRDPGQGTCAVGVPTGEYIDSTLNGTDSLGSGLSHRYVAFRVGFADPTWITIQ